MWWFIVALISCASLFAQEAAFFEIPVSGNPTYAVAASDGGTLIEVFYNLEGGAFHLTYALSRNLSLVRFTNLISLDWNRAS